MKRHYARRMPCVQHAYGAFIEGVMVGICTFGMPASPSLCIGVCGEAYRDSVVELNRLCVTDNTPFQTSEFLGECLKKLSQLTTNGKVHNKGLVVVSYADTEQGHIGKIYQATNWLYTGVTKERTDIGSEDGTHSRHYDRSLDYSTNRKKRSAKHRYVFFVGSKAWKKRARKALCYSIEPYPVGESKRYDTSAKIETQSLLFKEAK